MLFLFFTSQYFSCRHILMRQHTTFYRHFLAGTEEQVTELLKRVKELTCMPNPANLQLSTLHLQILQSL
jgi:hypothetical protein